MGNIKKGIRYQLMSSKKFISGFWITIILVDIAFYFMNGIHLLNINIGLSVGISNENLISVTGVNLLAILIALLVYNYERNYESFPLAISLSMTRKQYFISFIVDNAFIAFVFAAIQGVLLKIDPYFVDLLGRVPLNDFIYFNTKTDNILYIIFILFILFFAFTCFWNLMASVNYKFGYKMWIVIVGTNILLSILNIDVMAAIFKPINLLLQGRFDILQILIILAVAAVLYSVNYLIVIRTDINRKLS